MEFIQKMKKVFIITCLLFCFGYTSAQYCTSAGHNNNYEWISHVSLNLINNYSAKNTNAYGDYTSVVDSLIIQAGYQLTVAFGGGYNEYIDVWIDFNKNDTFDIVEKVMSSYGGDSVTASIIIPSTASLGKTRMRVIMNYSFLTTDPCVDSLVYGETEDYSVILSPNTLPPLADFSANKTISCNSLLTVQFQDLSKYVPESWLWDFGDGTTDTLQNPSHTYSKDSTYTVTMTVTNIFGTDTIIKSNYIIVTSDGPVAALCTLTTINNWGGIGIYNVTFDSINNTTANGMEGYKDYSCSQHTTVTAGVLYNISVQTGPNTNENVKVWIDYNSDGSFNDTTELVFQSNNVKTNHTGKIILPGSVTFDKSLRMRVASDYYGYVKPSPCVAINSGQAEDYSITILNNSNPPIADFYTFDSLSCNGSLAVSFKDWSQNLPGSWLWNFGDGTTDTSQQPVHTYGVDGSYTVSLIVSNIFGTDTITKTNYINISSDGPIPPSCKPITLNNFGNIGIYQLLLDSINNISADGKDSYQNYSCLHRASLTAGVLYNISVQTGPTYNENVRAWIDYNNDGIFNDTTEQVFSSNNKLINHSGAFMPSNIVVYDTLLRMRIGSDYSFIPASCTNVTYGQFEDYGIKIIRNTNPPKADFDVNDSSSCTSSLTAVFSDLSENIPTSWLWIFGDGTTDTVQNPTHAYSNDSTYTVTLIVTNFYGSDTIVKSSLIKVSSDGALDASCTPTTLNNSLNMGIYSVSLNGMLSVTADGDDKYKDYTCTKKTTITAGIPYLFAVQTGPDFYETVRAWIDYNNDGSFNDTLESFFKSDNKYLYHSDKISTPGNIIYNTPLRMRVASDYYGATAPKPCTNVSYGQFEDYTVVIQPNTNPPVSDFIADNTLACADIVNFTDLSKNLPSTWVWNFGDGSTSTLQNPSHTYSAYGKYTVTLIACNAYGCDTIIKTDYITKFASPKKASCNPTIATTVNDIGIMNVTFNTINKNSADAKSEGYVDFTCNGIQTELIEDATYKIKITTGSIYKENVRVWIDYTNNLSFSSSELVFSSDNKILYHTGDITIPATAIKNTPLRMRVVSAIISSPIPSYCNNIIEGQAEDYTVTVIAKTTPPVANFEYDETGSCLGTIDFTDFSVNNDSIWQWNFGDGTGTSTLQNPSYTYQTPGNYNVTLITSNTYGNDTVSKTVKISFIYADFIVTGDLNGVFFTNISTAADSAIWNFGNDSSSANYHTTHIYDTTGIYTVTLISYNYKGCYDTVSREVVVTNISANFNSINDQDESSCLIIYPNPTSKYVNINYSSDNANNIIVEIFDIIGEKIYSEEFTNTRNLYKQLDLSKYNKGIYLLRIINNDGQIIRKIIYQK